MPYDSSTSGKATYYLYYGTSTPVTIEGTVTDNSKYHVTVHATYNGVATNISNNDIDQVTFNTKLASGTTTLTVKATDAYGNTNIATITFIATHDSVSPTVSFNASPVNYHSANWAASPTIFAAYSANDNAGGSGLENGKVKFYLTSFKGTTTSFATNGGNDVNSGNLIDKFKEIDIVNKGATEVTLTIAATDNVGNATSASTTWTVNLTFSISSISTATVNSTTALILRFNTLYSTTTFTASDVQLTYSGITYYASSLTTPEGTTDISITQFASGSTSGPLVSAKDLKSGFYGVNVSNVNSANNNISLSNSGTSTNLP